MKTSQATLMLVLALVIGATSIVVFAQQGPTRYVRFAAEGAVSFGIREGHVIHQLKGELFHDPTPTGKTYNLADVQLLTPLDWEKVHKIIGVGANSAAAGVPITPAAYPILFAKLPQSLVTDGSGIPMWPEMKGGLIFEGEVVLVIGKRARYVSVADASEYIFGVAIGHDVQEIDWWRNGATGINGTNQPGGYLAKTNEGFAGIGTDIVSGVDYSNLDLTIKKNGKVVGVGNTSRFLNTPEMIVSFISRYIELLPGDLIYMGCFCADRDIGHPDQKLFVGDEVEFELENVGILRQTVVAAEVPPGATTWPDGYTDRDDLTELQFFPEPNSP